MGDKAEGHWRAGLYDVRTTVLEKRQTEFSGSAPGLMGDSTQAQGAVLTESFIYSHNHLCMSQNSLSPYHTAKPMVLTF